MPLWAGFLLVESSEGIQLGERPRRRIVFLRAGFLLVEFSKSIQLGERPARRPWLCLPSETHSPFHRGGEYQNKRCSLNDTVLCFWKHSLNLQQTTNNCPHTFRYKSATISRAWPFRVAFLLPPALPLVADLLRFRNDVL